jgi:hypothetical protein
MIIFKLVEQVSKKYMDTWLISAGTGYLIISEYRTVQKLDKFVQISIFAKLDCVYM